MKDTFPVYDISTLSEFRKEDIMISRFAPYLLEHKNLHLPHKHSFYHLLLFTQGAGSHTIDFQQFEVKPYQVYFMVPGQVHGWRFEGHVDGYVINFSTAFFQSFLLRPDYLEQFPFFTGNVNQSVLNIPGELHEQVTALFEQLITESEANERLAPDMVRAMMLQVFILVGRLSNTPQLTPANSYNHTLLRNFQQLIEKNFATLRLPKEYAELLYITPNHLNALCNDLLGIPAGEVIRNRITLEAKRLLVNFDLTINQVAARLNFDDNSYFSKFFRKQEGITPEQFRRQIKSL